MSEQGGGLHLPDDVARERAMRKKSVALADLARKVEGWRLQHGLEVPAVFRDAAEYLTVMAATTTGDPLLAIQSVMTGVIGATNRFGQIGRQMMRDTRRNGGGEDRGEEGGGGEQPGRGAGGAGEGNVPR